MWLDILLFFGRLGYIPLTLRKTRCLFLFLLFNVETSQLNLVVQFFSIVNCDEKLLLSLY